MHEMLHCFRSRRHYAASRKLVLAFPDFHALSIKNDHKRIPFVTIASLFVSFKQCSFLYTRFPNPQPLTLLWPLSLLAHIYSSSLAKRSEVKQSNFVKFLLRSFNQGHRLDYQVSSGDTTWSLSLWHTLCSSEHVFRGMQHTLKALLAQGTHWTYTTLTPMQLLWGRPHHHPTHGWEIHIVPFLLRALLQYLHSLSGTTWQKHSFKPARWRAGLKHPASNV